MNLAETVGLCRAIEAMFPAQRLDELTPEMWAPLLGDVPAGVALRATQEIAKEAAFIAVSDIRRTAHRMRVTTRRAVRQESRARNLTVDINSEADAAIASGAVDFTAIDLLKQESQDVLFYRPDVAQLTDWKPNASRSVLAAIEDYRRA